MLHNATTTDITHGSTHKIHSCMVKVVTFLQLIYLTEEIRSYSTCLNKWLVLDWPLKSRYTCVHNREAYLLVPSCMYIREPLAKRIISNSWPKQQKNLTVGLVDILWCCSSVSQVWQSHLGWPVAGRVCNEDSTNESALFVSIGRAGHAIFSIWNLNPYPTTLTQFHNIPSVCGCSPSLGTVGERSNCWGALYYWGNSINPVTAVTLKL